MFIIFLLSGAYLGGVAISIFGYQTYWAYKNIPENRRKFFNLVCENEKDCPDVRGAYYPRDRCYGHSSRGAGVIFWPISLPICVAISVGISITVAVAAAICFSAENILKSLTWSGNRLGLKARSIAESKRLPKAIAIEKE